MPLIDQIQDVLNKKGRCESVHIPKSKEDIPNNSYVVYVLSCDGRAIVVGKGKKSRASVIFDDLNRTTASHLKSFLVRAYHLSGKGSFERFLIECKSEKDAKDIERILHHKDSGIGGNENKLPPEIEEKLFDGLDKKSLAGKLLQIAQLSSYSGISDLKRWRRENIIDDETWESLNSRLKLGKENAD